LSPYESREKCTTWGLKGRKDSDLLAAVGTGDQQAFASLYARYSKPLYPVADRVCHDSASAEEVLQSVFLRVWLEFQTDFNRQKSLDCWQSHRVR
jgi:DNA-directed RNA polymerase specialized sigma24 family protein